MWTLKNHTPYKVAKSWGRDKDGVHEWIIAVKGTFDIGNIRMDGVPRLADEQLPPLIAAEYVGEVGASSLRYDCDLLGAKLTTDIVLNGTAYAPGGHACDEFEVGMQVGPVHKVLNVKGTRRWRRRLFIGKSHSEPVVQVPIVYERAYGGYDPHGNDPGAHALDPRNPVGRGVVAAGKTRDGLLMPNFEYPHGRLEQAGPAGFGAIDSFWSPRREHAGTYDDGWQQNRMPLLPLDWDPRVLQCAPVDQRPEQHLRGGEPVMLHNLTPGGSLQFSLPKVRLGFVTSILGRTEHHNAHLSSVIIEPDSMRLLMVWVSVLKITDDIDYLESTVVREKVLLR
jgi:hypothetical protein